MSWTMRRSMYPKAYVFTIFGQAAIPTKISATVALTMDTAISRWTSANLTAHLHLLVKSRHHLRRFHKIELSFDKDVIIARDVLINT
jgi:hypothetical protein